MVAGADGQQIIAALAVQIIVVVGAAAGDGAPKPVVLVVAGQAVGENGAGHRLDIGDRVETLLADILGGLDPQVDGDAAGRAVEIADAVESLAAVKAVIAEVAAQEIIAVAAVKRVVVGVPGQRVVAAAAIELVIARAAIEGVAAAFSPEEIGGAIANDEVVEG